MHAHMVMLRKEGKLPYADVCTDNQIGHFISQDLVQAHPTVPQQPGFLSIGFLWFLLIHSFCRCP